MEKFILQEEKRFGSGVHRMKPIIYEVNENGCWICVSHWQDKDGYTWVNRFGKVQGTHRYSYTIHKGEIPESLHILHSCDTPPCINPEHLRAGTNLENIQDKISRNRTAKSVPRR